jgi:hypothetical protein
MKLSDVRKLAIRKQVRIRWVLSNGMECLVDEHGIAGVPALRAKPAFNLEEEMAGARSFTLEPAGAKTKKAVPARPLSREELAVLAGEGGGDAAHHEDHDE